MKLTVEIRSAEGGEDSKLFVNDLANAYMRYFSRVGWINRILYAKHGEIAISVECDEASARKLEQYECGGHRIQRVPPTERYGRIQTSTVTVAVLREGAKVSASSFKESDFRTEWFSGTGCGGQHKNKHQNSCRVIHIPSGITESAQTRSRQNSYKLAKDALLKKLENMENAKRHSQRASLRQEQVGSGMRGDKIRTYRFKDDVVADHVSGKSASVIKVMKGNFDLLWN